mmetsp:Transcript_58765/g.108462  ORF Transcript_58765/g.108462 Transcript_58765/m.108462 type:complete len:349 (+) Transcript_58765:52-1098(+)
MRITRFLLCKPPRCYYDILGVPPTATLSDIKSAFREAAKRTHPDTRKHADSGFSGLVEAYRILRDPQKRREYDDALAARSTTSGSEGQFRQPWDARRPRGPREKTYQETASDAARARMYGYAPPEEHAEQAAAEEGAIKRTLTENSGSVVALLCAGLAFLIVTKQSHDVEKEKSLLQQRVKPRIADIATTAEKVVGGQKRVDVAALTPQVAKAKQLGEDTSQNHAVRVDDDPYAIVHDPGRDEEMVRSFYDPFSLTWQQIPAGFEAPGATDLIAWHKKRTDKVEWARLLAEGRLSEMWPRGGLKVAHRQRWETYPAVLLCDPVTGKTISIESRKLPPKIDRSVCEVKF